MARFLDCERFSSKVFFIKRSMKPFLASCLPCPLLGKTVCLIMFFTFIFYEFVYFLRYCKCVWSSLFGCRWHVVSENEEMKNKEGWVRVLEFLNEITLLPSLIIKWPFCHKHTKNTCHSVKKGNVVTQKIHIVCNYKAWKVHYLILNLRGQCAK